MCVMTRNLNPWSWIWKLSLVYSLYLITKPSPSEVADSLISQIVPGDGLETELIRQVIEQWTFSEHLSTLTKSLMKTSSLKKPDVTTKNVVIKHKNTKKSKNKFFFGFVEWEIDRGSDQIFPNQLFVCGWMWQIRVALSGLSGGNREIRWNEASQKTSHHKLQSPLNGLYPMHIMIIYLNLFA